MQLNFADSFCELNSSDGNVAIISLCCTNPGNINGNRIKKTGYIHGMTLFRQSSAAERLSY